MRSELLDIALSSLEDTPESDDCGSPDLGAEPVSSTNAPPNLREELLARVRSRIKTGYYDTSDVIDELSDNFAKAFNERP